MDKSQACEFEEQLKNYAKSLSDISDALCVVGLGDLSCRLGNISVGLCEVADDIVDSVGGDK